MAPSAVGLHLKEFVDGGGDFREVQGLVEEVAYTKLYALPFHLGVFQGGGDYDLGLSECVTFFNPAAQLKACCFNSGLIMAFPPYLTTTILPLYLFI